MATDFCFVLLNFLADHFWCLIRLMILVVWLNDDLILLLFFAGNKFFLSAIVSVQNTKLGKICIKGVNDVLRYLHYL